MNPNEWVKSRVYKMLCEDEYFDKDDMYPLSGIYIIRNLINHKVYIGQSVDVVNRFKNHKIALRNNNHYNNYLQRAWNKYGEDNFEFEIIESVEVEHLTYFENYYMEEYESYNEEFGYNNIQPSDNLSSNHLSESSKLKISEKNTEYSDEELSSYLHEFYYHNGKLPVSRDMMKRNGYPSRGTYDLRFGNFKNALVEAGLYDLVENEKLFNRKEYTKEEVLNIFREFIDTHGRYPSVVELKNTKETNLPSTSVIIKHFKSTKNLKSELGIDTKYLKEKEKEESLKLLHQLYVQDGYISARSIDKSRLTKSAGFYRDNFGNLANACKLANVPYAEHIKH